MSAAPAAKRARPSSSAQSSMLAFVSSSSAEVFACDGTGATWTAGSKPAQVPTMCRSCTFVDDARAPTCPVCSTRKAVPQRWTATVKLAKPLGRTVTLSAPLQRGAAAGHHREQRPTVSSVSMLKSHLQKCVRRRQAGRAVSSALDLLRHDENELLRRLPIIALEDVGTPVWFPEAVWLMCAVSKGFVMGSAEVARVLGWVRHLCACADKTRWTASDGDAAAPAPPADAGSAARTMQLAMLCRATYGGMRCDVAMCHAYALRHTAPVVGMAAPCEPVDPETVPRPSAAEWTLEGIDFHCAPRMVGMLTSALGNPGANDDAIKAWMWKERSSVNVRDDESRNAAAGDDGRPPPAFMAGAHAKCDAIARRLLREVLGDEAG